MRYVLSVSETKFDAGHYKVSPIGEPLFDQKVADSYAERTAQISEMCRIERMHLAEHGGEVSTWIDGRCVCTTTGNRRPIQQSIVNQGEPCEIEESIRLAVAASSAIADQAGQGKHSGDEPAGTRALDQGRIHHPGQQSFLQVTQ